MDGRPSASLLSAAPAGRFCAAGCRGRAEWRMPARRVRQGPPARPSAPPPCRRSRRRSSTSCHARPKPSAPRDGTQVAAVIETGKGRLVRAVPPLDPTQTNRSMPRHSPADGPAGSSMAARSIRPIASASTTSRDGAHRGELHSGRRRPRRRSEPQAASDLAKGPPAGPALGRERAGSLKRSPAGGFGPAGASVRRSGRRGGVR